MEFFILWISFRVLMVVSKGRFCLGLMTPVYSSGCTCSNYSSGGWAVEVSTAMVIGCFATV